MHIVISCILEHWKQGNCTTSIVAYRLFIVLISWMLLLALLDASIVLKVMLNCIITQILFFQFNIYGIDKFYLWCSNINELKESISSIHHIPKFSGTTVLSHCF